MKEAIDEIVSSVQRRLSVSARLPEEPQLACLFEWIRERDLAEAEVGLGLLKRMIDSGKLRSNEYRYAQQQLAYLLRL